MKFRIAVTQTAIHDIAEHAAYISRDSLSAAARWYDGCLTAIESLASLPRRCRLAPEAEAFEREIRHLIYHAHRIIFEVVGGTVYVLHVRHGARRPLGPNDGL